MFLPNIDSQAVTGVVALAKTPPKGIKSIHLNWIEIVQDGIRLGYPTIALEFHEEREVCPCSDVK